RLWLGCRNIVAYFRPSLGTVFLMSAIATTQLVGTGLGYWFGFAWVMSSPITLALALLGIAYLLLTMAANRFKREGLRLWLYRCSWGRGSISEWQGEEGHPKQMQALLETLQRPSVGGRALYYGGGSTPRTWIGFWIQIQVPAVLMGKEVTLQPALIGKQYFVQDELKIMKRTFYDQFLNGNWVNPKMLGILPTAPNEKNNSPADFNYSNTEQYRLWQVWIDTSIQNPMLELEIKYPSGVLQRNDGRGYMFRLALDWTVNEADRVNQAFSGELKLENETVLTKRNTPLLKLATPEKNECHDV
ncbi:T6SS effector BTH_I2691 family protein, partial [Pseudomonas sp. SDO528_S397]